MVVSQACECLVVRNEALSIQENEGVKLTPVQREKLNALLNEFSTICQQWEEPAGFAEHVTDTGDHKPVLAPPYHMPEPKMELLKKEVQSMISENIIEECESPWSFPVVLVPNKGGNLRLCVDY